MDLGLAGKTALVTGGGSGIGRACALALAREGVRVMICGRTLDPLQSTLDAMGGECAGHWYEQVDLETPSGPMQLLRAMAARFGEPDIVIQNVGGTLDVRDALAPLEDWRRVWRLNVEIGIELANAIVPQMQQRKSGRMIFVSSLAAFEQQGSLAYGVTKAALTAYARGIGRLSAADGVVVAAILPGVVMTDGGTWEGYQRRDPEGIARYVEEKLPRRRFGSPEEIADAVVFLASERAAAFCGSLVPMDGGQGASTFHQ
ncbi:MAG: SDR family NAD(P)-dependent oxidoreductase [Vulcanimicrobiaceae bacterium]